MSVELHILVDNAADSPLVSEHGLSILVDGHGRRLLFDTAATGTVLLGNARALGLDLSEIDAAVISHGHSDHTGGLVDVARLRPGLEVYAHPRAFSRRWADRPGKPLEDISCPHRPSDFRNAGLVLHQVKSPRMIEDWLVLSGPIGGPPVNPETFVVRKQGEIVLDGFEDELVMLVRGDDGWAVLTGCCHRGLRNTLRLASFLVRDEPIKAVVGGLHLRSSTAAGLAETVRMLQQMGSPRLYVGHCTGDTATAYLQEHLGDCIQPVSAGMKIQL